MGLAEHLARARHPVVLAVDGYLPGQQIQQYVRDTMLASLHRARVQVITTVRLIGADADSVYLQHTLTDEPVIVDNVSSLVLAQGHDPDDSLATELDGYDAPVLLIGDALAPRTVEEAVLEGLVAGSEI
jgi:hypothetical protein